MALHAQVYQASVLRYKAHEGLCCMQNGPAYCQAFLNVLRNVTKEEAVQYVLALINDMLSGKCCLSVCFHLQSATLDDYI